MGWLARNAPALNAVQVAAMRRELASPARRERGLRPTGPPRRKPRTPRCGSNTKRPWAFPLSEVKTPVHLWHGALDRNAPVAYARGLARELPDATLYIGDSSGHGIGRDRSGEIMSVLASHTK
jgi:pimeloyl-ACP methyl ester carboxylesterase